MLVILWHVTQEQTPSVVGKVGQIIECQPCILFLGYPIVIIRAMLVAQSVANSPAMQETQV